MSENNMGVVLALGYFDGVHIGHKAVLEKALSLAKDRQLTPAVLIFSTHPKKILTGAMPPIITDNETKKDILKGMGFKLIPFDFESKMNMPPCEFAKSFVAKELQAKAVVCGYDYRYGKGGEGTAERLKNDLKSEGVEVFSVDKVKQGEDTISSSKIRQLIAEGDIKRANEMLGKTFSYNRVVERGNALGRKLGFPTINQSFPEDFIVPKFGVYVSQVSLNGKNYAGVTNIGVRPTVDGEHLKSETCILGFSGEVYGQRVQVGLMDFLREEKKFSCVEELSKTVKQDMEKARWVYNEVMKNG